jgi:hypothetical protein
MARTALAILTMLVGSGPAFAEAFQWEGWTFETRNVHASVVTLKGESVLRLERDLKALPFDAQRLGDTVDDRTFARLKNFEFSDAVFEVKVLARVLRPTPFPASQGFIGVYFRVNADDTAFESIYLRPNAGRADSQAARNHAVQYFAFPGFKFDRLRKESPGLYETYADIGLDQWITMRVHVTGERAELYLNDAKFPSFIVNRMKGASASGTIGLYVDIGTEGYFKDFRILSYQPARAAGGA